MSLELAGSRIRLRASMPPRPADPPGSPWRQQRISTGLEYPARASEAVALAETFDWSPWEQMGRARNRAGACGGSTEGVSHVVRKSTGITRLIGPRQLSIHRVSEPHAEMEMIARHTCGFSSQRCGLMGGWGAA